MAVLNGLPDMEVWMVDGQAYLVTYVPGTDIPLAWTISDAELTAAFGPGQPHKFDRTISGATFNAVGAIIKGDRAELANPTEDPYLAWENSVTKQAAVRPWLLDEEVLTLIAEGVFEGREISLAEFQQTNWWQSRTEGERAWAELVLSDPKTAQQRMDSNKLVIADFMRQAGILEPPEELVDLLTTQFTTGVWSEVQWQMQVRALSDPYSDVAYEPEVQDILNTGLEVDTTREGELNVRDEALRWLGPVYGRWSDTQIAKWAGKIRNDPDAMTELQEELGRQRLAMFPEHANASLTYEDIASPWRNFMTQMWGQTADELDPLFAKLLRNNDSAKNAELLRREGLNRGVGKVKNDMLGGFAGEFGQIRRPI